MNSYAVVALDMTRDSMESHRAIDERIAAAQKAKPFLKWCRSRKIPIIFSNGLRRETDKWFWNAGWQKHCIDGSKGLEPHTSLFQQGDIVVHKRRYSNFFDTELNVTLRELGVNSIILIGWSTSVAVLLTAVDAWQFFYGVIVPKDLTVAHAWGGYSVEEQQKWALAYIETFAIGKISTSNEIMNTNLLDDFVPGKYHKNQD